jgi:hypothetical protein
MCLFWISINATLSTSLGVFIVLVKYGKSKVSYFVGCNEFKISNEYCCI